MALGLPTGSAGDIKARLKYDARAGRMFKVQRVQDGAGAYFNDDVDISQGFEAVFDMASIRVGWVRFVPGAAPDIRTVLHGEKVPDKPSPDHSYSLDLPVLIKDETPLREFRAQARVVMGEIDKLHDAWIAHGGPTNGQVPVVAMDGATPVKSGQPPKQSTNYAPNFRIVKWIDRPAALGPVPTPGAATPKAAAPAPQSGPPTTGATQRQPEPAGADDNW